MEELETEAENTRSGTTPTLHGLQLDAGGDERLEPGDEQRRLDPRAPVTFESEDESNWSEDDTETNRRIGVAFVPRSKPQTPAAGRSETTTEGE